MGKVHGSLARAGKVRVASPTHASRVASRVDLRPERSLPCVNEQQSKD